MRRLIASSAAVAFGLLVGCREGPTSLRAPAVLAPSFAIADGSQSGGNPHFFFLPPLANEPRPHGVFDGSQLPVVSICAWSGSACGASVATFTTVQVDAAGQRYQVLWHSDRCQPACAPAGGIYRIQVTVLGTRLGYADVQIAAHGAAGSPDPRPGTPLVLQAGATLPIAFRIEVGAVFPVVPTAQPQTIQTPPTDSGSTVQLAIPSGALTQPTGVTALPAALPPSTPTTNLVGGTTYDFGPSGTTFTAPVTVTIAYDPALIPRGMHESTLRLYTLVNGKWQVVPGSSVDTVNHQVVGATTHFSTYGAQGGIPASITLTPGGDTLATGQSEQLVATVFNATGDTVYGAPLTFTASDPSVATVTSGGLVTAAGTGAATISVSTLPTSVTATATFAVPACAPDSVYVGGAGNRFLIPVSYRGIPASSDGSSALGQYTSPTNGATPVLFGAGPIFGTSAAFTLGYDPDSVVSTAINPSPVCTLAAAGSFAHTYTKLPLSGAGFAGLVARQESFAAPAPNDGFVLLKYSFTNTGSAPITNFWSGFAVDWDLYFRPGVSDDVVRYDAALGIGEAVESDTLTYPQMVAAVPIAAGIGTSIQSFVHPFSPVHSNTPAELFALLTSGTRRSAIGPADIRQLVGRGPATIPAGGRLVVYIALVGGDNRTDFTNNLAAARAAAGVIESGPNPPVAAVLISGDTLLPGDTATLAATPVDFSGNPLQGHTVSYTTSDPNVATVSPTGLVTGVGTGTAVITATTDGAAGTATVVIPACSASGDSVVIHINQMVLAVTSQGLVPPSPSSILPLDSFADTPVIFAGGPLFGTDAASLAVGYDPSGRVGVANIARGPVCTTANAAEHHTYARLLPAAGGTFPGLEVRQHTIAYASAPDDNYVLFRYTFTNTGSTALSGFWAGMVTDFDIYFDGDAGTDRVSYDPGLGLLEVGESNGIYPATLGIIPIAAAGDTSLAAFKNGLPPGGSDPVTYADFFSYLTGKLTQTQIGDIREMAGRGNVTIPPGGRYVIYFAIVGGADRNAFLASVASAVAKAQQLGQ